jgi:2'-5' RNA ligase
MLPGDRLICAFVQPVKVGTHFQSWLLHVTIVPWFRLPDSSEKLSQGLEKALSSIRPFTAIVGGEEKFGAKKNRPVNLLETSDFVQIQLKVREYLHKKRALIIDETTKIKRPYRPHITHQMNARPNEGDKVWCDRIFVVEQRGDHKSVVAEMRLDEKTA